MSTMRHTRPGFGGSWPHWERLFVGELFQLPMPSALSASLVKLVPGNEFEDQVLLREAERQPLQIAFHAAHVGGVEVFFCL